MYINKLKLWSHCFSRERYFPQVLGHSCKIGNTDLLGTSKNQNHQLCEICHFCLIFTLQQCIVAQKLIRQPYSSFSQHFVACLWEFSVPRRHRKKYTAHLARKSILSAQIKCQWHHLMLKSMSWSIYVLFSLSSGTCSINSCPEETKSFFSLEIRHWNVFDWWLSDEKQYCYIVRRWDEVEPGGERLVVDDLNEAILEPEK